MPYSERNSGWPPPVSVRKLWIDAGRVRHARVGVLVAEHVLPVGRAGIRQAAEARPRLVSRLRVEGERGRVGLRRPARASRSATARRDSVCAEKSAATSKVLPAADLMRRGQRGACRRRSCRCPSRRRSRACRPWPATVRPCGVAAFGLPSRLSSASNSGRPLCSTWTSVVAVGEAGERGRDGVAVRGRGGPADDAVLALRPGMERQLPRRPGDAERRLDRLRSDGLSVTHGSRSGSAVPDVEPGEHLVVRARPDPSGRC